MWLVLVHLRSAIFQLEEVDAASMDEATQKQVLNQILRVSQEKFGYEHYEEPNEKFDFLTKYLFEWTEGFATETGSEANTSMVSRIRLPPAGNRLERRATRKRRERRQACAPARTASPKSTKT